MLRRRRSEVRRRLHRRGWSRLLESDGDVGRGEVLHDGQTVAGRGDGRLGASAPLRSQKSREFKNPAVGGGIVFGRF